MTKPSLVGTEAEGYDTTITFKDGKVSYLESYWGTKKNGTYSVQGDTLIIKYKQAFYKLKKVESNFHFYSSIGLKP